MALQIQPQNRLRLKVATATVKKVEKNGPLFYILPPLLVVAVLLFCYLAPSPVTSGPSGKPESTSPQAAVAAAAPVAETQGIEIDESSFVADQGTENPASGEEMQMEDGEYPDLSDEEEVSVEEEENEEVDEQDDELEEEEEDEETNEEAEA